MLKTRKKIAIVGATSAIAEHCARLWVLDEPVDLVLVGRNDTKLAQLATDLRVRSPQSTITHITVDLLDPAAIRRLSDSLSAGQPIDILLIAHGSLPDQDQCQQNLQSCLEALNVNGISPVLLAEAFAGHMQKANRGTLAVIGSVAGDRGRKSNYVYGAAKGLVATYVQGLQHRLASTNVRAVLIKPGPTDTPMTAHLKNSGGRLASVEEVAQLIVTGIRKGSPVIYAPKKWMLIMTIIRLMPRFIFNKLNI